mgnify:CR=1 FL=1
MDLGLNGLGAVVTGASKGLGLATALQLLREGAHVVINSRSETHLRAASDLLHKEGFTASQFAFIAGDVSDPIFCENLANQAKQVLGSLDILITNSGGPPPGTFEHVDQAQWENAIDLSFNSHRYLISQFLPYLKKSPFPSVLAVTSFTVKYPLDNLILSNTVRAATAALIKSLSIELGPIGIRFNSILPGWTLTDRVQQLLDSRAATNQTSADVELKKITDSIPLRRLGKPEEFARVAAFLVSPAASYVNGVLLNVDGGITRGLF